MLEYNDTVLVDVEYNRVSSIIIDYYSKGVYAYWSGYIYNDTVTSVQDCKIVTTSELEGVFYVSGGAVTDYTAITSNIDTTATIGTITAGELVHVSIRTFISGGSPLTGLQSASIYITKS